MGKKFIFMMNISPRVPHLYKTWYRTTEFMIQGVKDCKQKQSQSCDKFPTEYDIIHTQNAITSIKSFQLPLRYDSNMLSSLSHFPLTPPPPQSCSCPCNATETALF